MDLDNDGWSYENDFNDGDPTQWSDTDGDGFGDNYDDTNWSEGRTVGQFVEGATQPDRCPEEYSAFLYSDTEGCLSSQKSTETAQENNANSEEDTEESNLVLILGIAATGVIFVLFGAIAVLIRKKPKSKSKEEISAVHPALESDNSNDIGEGEELAQKVMDEVESTQSVDFVSTWEELPDGEWLPNDENGVNWYQDKDGRYWHSTDDGFIIWNE